MNESGLSIYYLQFLSIVFIVEIFNSLVYIYSHLLCLPGTKILDFLQDFIKHLVNKYNFNIKYRTQQ